MIKKVTQADFNIVYRLYMHPETNPFLLYEKMDEEDFAPIFEELLKNQVLYLYYQGETVFGMFKLIRLVHRCSHIMYLGGLAIDPVHFGGGHGTKMLQEIIGYCKELDILRIELSVAIHNEKAIKLYEKMGFEKEGILRNYAVLKKDNVMFDEILMSYLY